LFLPERWIVVEWTIVIGRPGAMGRMALKPSGDVIFRQGHAALNK